MIDLTPLEVRKKKGDFRRAMRGYDPALVDDFLDLVADRLDELVRENMALTERTSRQDTQVAEYRERERALTEALVSAQEMREEMRRQSTQEADLARRVAEQEVAQLRAATAQEAAQLRASAQQEAAQLRAAVQREVAELRTGLRSEREREENALRSLRVRQEQFITSYRGFLQRELTELGVIAETFGYGGSAAAAISAAGLGTAGATASERASRAGRDAQDTDALPDMVAGGRDVAGGAAALPHAVESFDPESFDPEPFEPEPFEPEPFEPEDSIDSGADVASVADADDVVSAVPEAAAGTDAPADRAMDAGDGFIASLFDEEAAALGGDPAPTGTDAGDDLEMYDVVAADGGEAGVPGPIGLGSTKQGTWASTPDWTLDGVNLAGPDAAEPDDGYSQDLPLLGDTPSAPPSPSADARSELASLPDEVFARMFPPEEPPPAPAAGAV
jgi:DivIVA domain-containing protein